MIDERNKIIRKDRKKKVFDNEMFTRFIIEVPMRMKVLNDNKIERVNNYISFILFMPCINDFPEINKNSYIEIRGELLGNSYKNEDIDDCLVIYPKTIKKGVKI